MSDRGTERPGRRTVSSMREIAQLSVDPERPFYSATHEEIASGWTSDVYFVKAREILREMGLEKTRVAAEIFASRPGILCGVRESTALLEGRGVKMWTLPEGAEFESREVVARLQGAYDRFGLFETALLGLLASSSAWATRAREVVRAAGGRPVVSFGARHVHPAVAPSMERAASVGGASGVSCILAARMMGDIPTGTMPHAAVLIAGDTVELARAYHRVMPPSERRIILVDTFRDEVEESLRVARELGEDLYAVRLDTPSERGGVTPDLVREVRAHLEAEGFDKVRIFVSGGLNPERVQVLAGAGADGFGVGSYISGARPIDMTMDIREVEGRPVAKRGRLPGLSRTERLERVL